MARITLHVSDTDHRLLKALSCINRKSMSSMVSAWIRKFSGSVDLDEFMLDQRDGQEAFLRANDGTDGIPARKVFDELKI